MTSINSVTAAPMSPRCLTVWSSGRRLWGVILLLPSWIILEQLDWLSSGRRFSSDKRNGSWGLDGQWCRRHHPCDIVSIYGAFVVQHDRRLHSALTDVPWVVGSQYWKWLVFCDLQNRRNKLHCHTFERSHLYPGHSGLPPPFLSNCKALLNTLEYLCLIYLAALFPDEVFDLRNYSFK